VSASVILIKNVHLIDPSQSFSKAIDVLISGGIIKKIGKDLSDASARIIDADGLIGCPGFIDLHCHLRQPGFEHKETIASGSAAACRGGFTTICCMPNTNPALDNAGAIDYVMKTAASEAPQVNVLPVGCITKARAGKEIVEMSELAGAGCVAFSDDGSPVSSSRLMSLAMENAAGLGLPIIDHCEDLDLSEGGQLHDGWVAARLGMKGIPSAAEESAVARDIALAELTGARLHITHVSTRGAVELIRNARLKGLPLTADVTPHHLTLTEERVISRPDHAGAPLAYDTNAKVNPPLRTASDIEALILGLNDGTIDAIATDHAPHADEDKLCEFEIAASGISGFDTALGVLLTFLDGKIALDTLVACLTSGPARVLGIGASGAGTLKTSSPADMVLIDTKKVWMVEADAMLSKGKNTPYLGQQLKGMVAATLHRGELVYAGVPERISR